VEAFGSGGAGAQTSDTAYLASTRSADSAVSDQNTGRGPYKSSPAARSRVRCPDARKGLAWYRARYNESLEGRGLDTTWPVGRKPLSCADAKQLAKVWRQKAQAARINLERWRADETHWERWLPKLWYAIGMCETALDWHFDSGTYVSAFGIIRSAFPTWNGNNTPREQYRVALGIANRYGLGAWGCYSHGGYRYHMG